MIWPVGRTLTVLTALHKLNVYRGTAGVGATAETNGKFFLTLPQSGFLTSMLQFPA